MPRASCETCASKHGGTSAHSKPDGRPRGPTCPCGGPGAEAIGASANPLGAEVLGNSRPWLHETRQVSFHQGVVHACARNHPRPTRRQLRSAADRPTMRLNPPWGPRPKTQGHQATGHGFRRGVRVCGAVPEHLGYAFRVHPVDRASPASRAQEPGRAPSPRNHAGDRARWGNHEGAQDTKAGAAEFGERLHADQPSADGVRITSTSAPPLTSSL